MTEFAFRFPSLGSALVEAEVIAWLVAEGDPVAKDEPLVEVDTEKSTVDLPSPLAGRVVRHGAREGERIKVGDVLAVIDGDVSDLPAALLASPQTAPPAPAAAAPVGVVAPRGGPDVRATPHVRRLARELGVRLEDLTGSGPGGAITDADVRAAA